MGRHRPNRPDRERGLADPGRLPGAGLRPRERHHRGQRPGPDGRRRRRAAPGHLGPGGGPGGLLLRGRGRRRLPEHWQPRLPPVDEHLRGPPGRAEHGPHLVLRGGHGRRALEVPASRGQAAGGGAGGPLRRARTGLHDHRRQRHRLRGHRRELPVRGLRRQLRVDEDEVGLDPELPARSGGDLPGCPGDRELRLVRARARRSPRWSSRPTPTCCGGPSRGSATRCCHPPRSPSGGR